MKTEISENQRLQLIGLLTLAKMHNDKLKDIEAAALAITGEDSDCGHTCDAVYQSYEADEMLRKLGISVTPNV